MTTERKVIFLNRHRLDCRKENLKVIDYVHAERHKGVRRDSSSGVKGVRFDWDTRSYVATLHRERRAMRLGRYRTIEEAEEAFKRGVANREKVEGYDRSGFGER